MIPKLNSALNIYLKNDPAPEPSTRRVCGRDLILTGAERAEGRTTRRWTVMPGDALSDRCLSMLRSPAGGRQIYLQSFGEERSRIVRLILRTYLETEALSFEERQRASQILELSQERLSSRERTAWLEETLRALDRPSAVLRLRGLEVASLLHLRLPRTQRLQLEASVARLERGDPAEPVRRNASQIRASWE